MWSHGRQWNHSCRIKNNTVNHTFCSYNCPRRCRMTSLRLITTTTTILTRQILFGGVASPWKKGETTWNKINFNQANSLYRDLCVSWILAFVLQPCFSCFHYYRPNQLMQYWIYYRPILQQGQVSGNFHKAEPLASSIVVNYFSILKDNTC